MENELSEDVKERLQTVIDLATTTFNYGYIPFIIYLGWKLGPDSGCRGFRFTHFLFNY
jgi:hypothetical protein